MRAMGNILVRIYGCNERMDDGFEERMDPLKKAWIQWKNGWMLWRMDRLSESGWMQWRIG